jgi:hypothetical protein
MCRSPGNIPEIAGQAEGHKSCLEVTGGQEVPGSNPGSPTQKCSSERMRILRAVRPPLHAGRGALRAAIASGSRSFFSREERIVLLTTFHKKIPQPAATLKAGLVWEWPDVAEWARDGVRGRGVVLARGAREGLRFSSPGSRLSPAIGRRRCLNWNGQLWRVRSSRWSIT